MHCHKFLEQLLCGVWDVHLVNFGGLSQKINTFLQYVQLY
jgi:hypothetical protein